MPYIYSFNEIFFGQWISFSVISSTSIVYCKLALILFSEKSIEVSIYLKELFVPHRGSRKDPFPSSFACILSLNLFDDESLDRT